MLRERHLSGHNLSKRVHALPSTSLRPGEDNLTIEVPLFVAVRDFNLDILESEAYRELLRAGLLEEVKGSESYLWRHLVEARRSVLGLNMYVPYPLHNTLKPRMGGVRACTSAAPPSNR